MTKKILLSISLACLLLTFLFWNSISGALLRTCIDSYCRHHFGSAMHAENIYKEEGFWVFDKPRLSHNGAELAAERLRFRVGVHPIQRTVELDMAIERSRIDLGEEISNIEEVVYEIVSKSVPVWLFKVHSTFAVEDGKLAWRERGGDAPAQQEVDFHFQAVSETDFKKASLHLYLDGNGTSSNVFELDMDKAGRSPLRAELCFKHVECQKLARIYKAMGHPYHGWDVYDGIADGTVHYLLPERQRGYAWGKAVLKDFSFGNSRLELAGSIAEAVVDLETRYQGGEVPRVMGKVRLDQEAAFSISKFNAPYWEMGGLKGAVEFLPEEGVQAAFSGWCRHGDHEFDLAISGEASVYNESQAAVEISCSLSSPDKEDAEIHALVRQVDAENSTAQLHISSIGKEEVSLVQSALEPFFPDIREGAMRKGRLSAGGIVYLNGCRLTDAVVDQITGTDLVFDFDPLDMRVAIENVAGEFSINLASGEPLESFDASFSLEDGNVSFLGLNDHLWEMKEISTAVNVRKGVLQQSEMFGHFAGLTGAIIVDWTSPEEFLQINFNGPAKNLASFLPGELAVRIENTFKTENVNILGGMAREGSGARFAGKLRFFDEKGVVSDVVGFGCDVEKCSERLWKRWPADELAVSYWEHAGLEAMQKALPPLAAPLVLFESNWMKAESGIAGLVLRKGWFEAKNLSLEKYLGPFLFPSGKITLEGRGNFTGVFDHKRLAVEYDGSDIILENPYFKLTAPRVKANRTGKGKNKSAHAAHYFDFETGLHYGTIPLADAAYLEKNSGLLFEDTEASVILEGDKIHFSELTASCMGVDLGGSVDLEFGIPDDGIFSLRIKVDQLAGRLSEMKKILAGFHYELPLQDVPADGKLALLDRGAVLDFQFSPEEFTCGAKIHGAVSEGSFAFQNSSVKLRDGKLNFFYDHQNQALNLSNISAGVVVGEAGQEERYVLAGEYIRFTDLARDSAEFDVWVGDEKRDIVRLVGKTVAADEEVDSGKVVFHINPDLSHFGDVHPSRFTLVVRDWNYVERFSLGLDIRLNTLFRDIQRFGSSALLPASRGISKGLANIRTAYGHALVDLDYSGQSREFTYRVRGEDVAFSDYVFQSCELAGRKSGDYWCIDRMRLDDVTLSAYLRSKKNSWSFDQLKFTFGKAIAMELDGDYSPDSNKVEARVSSLEIDFGGLGKCSPLIDSFIESCSPHGVMTASGDLQLDFTGHSPGWRAEAILDASFTSWDVNGLHFQDVQNVSCHFVSDQGVSLRNLSTGIVTPDTRSTRAHIGFEKAYYEFLNGEVVFDSLSFQVPAHHLPWFADAMSESFPLLFTSSVADTMRNCKLQGCLEGVLQYEYNPPYTAMQLKLKDGEYLFLNTAHYLRDFVMEYDPFEFKVASKYSFGEDLVWLYARSTSPNLSNGELVLTGIPPDQQGRSDAGDALFMLWENDPHHGFSLRSAEGDLYGMSFRMQRDPTEPLSDKVLYLVGQIDIDAQKVKAVLPADFSRKISDWHVGNGYRLKGKWRFLKEGSQEYMDRLHFLGTFEGDRFAFKGYRFDTLEAHLEYTPKSARFRDLHVADASGALYAEQIDLVKGKDEHWYFSLPSLKVENFTPSALQPDGHPRPYARKPFTIRELALEGCQGSFADSESIIGGGSFRFTNRSKKRLQNTIFQIPSDILSRIGLDLAVLTPVTGSVDYKIQGGRVYFTKFKDIYSEGKLSKFYLSGASPSTLDFNGNLNVQVRMKQHNLLFKLAELFTVNVGGTLLNPSYSLQQPSRGDVASHK